MTIFPKQEVSPLQVETVNDGIWNLFDQNPKRFTMIVFYRGLHCPVCKSYLRDLKVSLEALNAQGVEVIAISSDSKDRAERAVKDWELEGLVVGYDFPVEKASEWGLFVSEQWEASKNNDVPEPEEFVEPGLFLIDSNFKLYASSIQTMPFARPPINDIVEAFKIIKEKNYPARGGSVAAVL